MWIELTPILLRTHLAQSELEALANVERTYDVEHILKEECRNVAEAWRGRLRQFMAIDKRSNYVPSELLIFILSHVRYASYTRLPAMQDLLDELRRDEWRRANEIFDNPRKINVEETDEPEESSSSGNPVVIIPRENWRFE